MAGSNVIAASAAILISPILLLAALPLVLSLAGSLFKSSTAARRDEILVEYRRDLKALQQRRRSDDSWERLEKADVTESAHATQWQGIVGFFHPFCNAGGGGERVLWAAIAATQRRYPKAICAVYTGDNELERASCVTTVKDRFDITLQEHTLQFVYLQKRHYVLASTWPHFTLLGQSLGSLFLAWEAFSLLTPDIFIDTMGYAFAVALCKWLFPSVPTAAYVHYPTISTDMLESLDDATGEKGLNAGKGSGWKGRAKKAYWHVFARLYGWVGGQIDVVMCNSTWTSNHITQLWARSGSSTQKSRPATILYPPCPVEELESKVAVDQTSEKQRENIILYIAQFRPEKNHSMILRAFAKYHHQYVASSAAATPGGAPPKLVLIGSVRTNTPDERHVYSLRLLARELKIQDATTFICDAPFSTILEHLQKANIGVNGMYNEHFGIGNVEGLAAGCIPVVHNSGGPKLDIVVPFEGKPTGFHASNEDEYAEAFAQVGELSETDRLSMRLRGRKSAKRFTEAVFVEQWNKEMDRLIAMTRQRSS